MLARQRRRVRTASTQTLTAMKCTGSTSCQGRESSRFTSGMSATTIGRNRTLDSATATAVSISDMPGPRPVTSTTCAGPAHCSAVDSIAQPTGKP